MAKNLKGIEIEDFERRADRTSQNRPLLAPAPGEAGVYQRAFNSDAKDLTRAGLFSVFKFSFWQVG